MEIIVKSKSPDDCNKNELKTFEELVIEGGEVDAGKLSERILNAEHLFFVYLNEKCVGTGAIKRPRVEYKLNTFRKAGVLGQGKYEYELGWIYVNEKMRGLRLGSKLMESICHYMSESLSGKACFATVRQNNDCMQYLLVKCSFSKVGKSYKSIRGNYFLDLYVKAE